MDKNRHATLAWLWKVPGRKKGFVAALTVVQAVAGTTGVLYALLLRNLVDSAVNHSSQTFLRSVVWLLLLVAFELSVYALIRWLNELSKATLENAFKKRLVESILNRDYASVHAIHSGEWVNRLTNDAVVVTGGCTEILPGLASTVVRLISALIMLILLDKQFALVLMPAGLALVGLTYVFRRILKRLHRQVQESDGRLRVFLQERISSLMVIKSFAAEEHTLRETSEKLNAHKNARMKRNHFSNFCNFGFAAAMNGMYLFCLIYCAHGILTDTISYGTLTAVMQLVGQVQGPFANISGYLPRWYAMTASAERLMEIERYARDSEEPPLSLPEILDYYQNRFSCFGLRNATFTYVGEDMPIVLKYFFLNVRKGEYVAFTGHSGCGKSTVLKLLLCMYPLEWGERYIDGQPLTAKWRRLFAYVPQGNALMTGSIREVVSFADPSQAGNDEKLWAALDAACAGDFVRELETGLDTLLGEQGTGLSEGQMQRIAIARAIFSESPILLLDEATSALDDLTEKQLLQNLRSLTDKTVLIVTHRPAALSICDRAVQFSAPEE